MTVGAQAPNIVRLVTIPLFATVAVGAMMGMVAGLFSARYLTEIFYQVRPTDGSMLALPAAAIVVAACIAALPATLRALRTDPASTLRAE